MDRLSSCHDPLKCVQITSLTSSEARGLFLHANGDRYEGGFLNNQRSGHGMLVLADGAVPMSTCDLK
eukprot:765494-Hanusia_phi.AAC.9